MRRPRQQSILSKMTSDGLLPHTEAATALLCSKLRLPDYAAHVGHFETVITFEDVEKNFPNASPTGALANRTKS